MEFPKKILVVDDEFLLRYTLSLILQRAGYEVITVTRGCEALDYLQGGKCDLVILDISMPGKNGLSVLSEIRQSYPGTRVIMLTAYPSSDTMHEAKSKGALEYLVKPIGPERVLEVVKRMTDMN